MCRSVGQLADQYEADRYERLKAREDYEHNLRAALSAIRSFDHADIVEWGAGTGRVSALLAPRGPVDDRLRSQSHMLHVAAAKYRALASLALAASPAIITDGAAADRVADVSLAGWTLCYLARKFYGEIWQQQLTQAIEQMRRVLRPGGTIIIIETLGTGCDRAAPRDWLAEYYRLSGKRAAVSTRRGCAPIISSTSLDEAVELISFFFGDAVGESRRNNWIITAGVHGNLVERQCRSAVVTKSDRQQLRIAPIIRATRRDIQGQEHA